VGVESLIANVGEPARAIVVGVVPDGIATVKIRESDGRMIVVDVTRNGYEALIAHPRSVEFVRRDHRYVVQLSSFDGGRYEPPSTGSSFGPP
jgi:hypothetical protein